MIGLSLVCKVCEATATNPSSMMGETFSKNQKGNILVWRDKGCCTSFHEIEVARYSSETWAMKSVCADRYVCQS